MGFSQSVSGLNAASSSLDVIGNNIANSATVGFKASSVAFADMFDGSSSAVGMGTQVSKIVQNFNDGTPTTTSRNLDIAISQNGFFRLENSAGSVYYSRNGQFTLDKNSNITDMQGKYLTGYPASTDTPPVILQGADPVKLTVPQSSMAAQASTTGKMVVNLDSNTTVIAPPITPTTFNPDNPATYNYVTSMTAFDSLGNTHNVSMYFVKTAINTWDLYPIDRSAAPPPSFTATTFQFDPSGKLTAPAPAATVTVALGALNGSLAGTMNVDFTGTTQQNSGAGSATSMLSQNGYPAGNFVGFVINQDGKIAGNFSNQQQQLLGQIVLANFTNTEGLVPQGDNTWQPGAESGQAMLGLAGQGNYGRLTAGALESSNTDLGNELVNMIVAQRAYQSNAQSIKTQDSILNTLVNLR